MDRALVLIVIGSVVIVGAIAAFVMVASGPTGMLIGERDAHGCPVAVGYVYDADVGACIRSGELDGDARIAAMAAANHVGFSDGLTVVSVDAGDCEGCYTVVLDRSGTRSTVVLEDWVVQR